MYMFLFCIGRPGTGLKSVGDGLKLHKCDVIDLVRNWSTQRIRLLGDTEKQKTITLEFI